MKKLISLILAAVMVFAVCACGSTSTPEPSQDASEAVTGNIEFISCYNAGGGHDKMLRAMEQVLHGNNILDNNINIVYKPGGNSAVGMSYCAGKDGSNNHVMCTTIGFVTAPLTTDTGDLNYEKFKPICRLGVDVCTITVRSDLGITSMEDLANYQGKLTWGGAAVGGMENMAYIKVKEATGIDCEYVPFDNDGETITALLGGHVDIIAAYSDATQAYIDDGTFTAIAVTGEERKAALPEIPTLIECGYDIIVNTFRGVVGAPNMSDEAVAWYEAKFEEMAKSPEFMQAYYEANAVDPAFLNAADFAAELDRFNADMVDILGQLNMLK